MVNKMFLLHAVIALGMAALSGQDLPQGDFYKAFVSADAAVRKAWMTNGIARAKMAEIGTPPAGAPADGLPCWYDGFGIGNMRDVGGWKGLDGRRIRKGLLFRAAHFGTCTNRTEFRRKFGVKTDLDLRETNTVARLKGRSPLHGDVALVNRSAPAYERFGSKSGRRYFRDVFSLFLDRGNYPIAFHCAKGADRTGSLAFLLQGLLGACENDQSIDWQVTAFYNPNPKFRDAERYDRLVAMIAAQDGTTWTDKFVSYARSCGISDAEIARFRDIMLE